jgi:hypothetical protein
MLGALPLPFPRPAVHLYSHSVHFRSLLNMKQDVCSMVSSTEWNRTMGVVLLPDGGRSEFQFWMTVKKLCAVGERP